MLIDLSRIEDEAKRFAEELTLDPDRLDAERVVSSVEVCLDGRVERVGASVRTIGDCSAAGRLVCSRCLVSVPWTATEHFDLELRTAADAPVDAELALEVAETDVTFLDAPVLDTADLAVEQVLLALPMRPLCREDCAGLCPRCGADRNREGACRCEPEPDARWQPLKGLTGSGS